MGYGGLTAFLDTSDQRSHLDWVNAVLYSKYRDLWETTPLDFKLDMAALCDAAVDRALAELRTAWESQGATSPPKDG